MTPRKSTSTNYQNERELLARCPLAAAMKLLGGRWKVMLLWYVHHGQQRPSELSGVMPHVSRKMLFQQLQELTADGLLCRTPGRNEVRYALTELGQTLVPIMRALETWGATHDVGNRVIARALPDTA